MDSEFMAILEVCGFNDWLIAELHKWKCREIVLIHPEKPSKKKTDQRDARKLCDLLWLNRERLSPPKSWAWWIEQNGGHIGPQTCGGTAVIGEATNGDADARTQRRQDFMTQLEE